MFTVWYEFSRRSGTCQAAHFVSCRTPRKLWRCSSVVPLLVSYLFGLRCQVQGPASGLSFLAHGLGFKVEGTPRVIALERGTEAVL